jgi:hypothetical protein
MKTVSRVLLGFTALCLLLMGALITLSSTNWFANKVQDLLMQRVEESDWTISIGKVETHFPLYLEIESLVCSSPSGLSVTAKNIKFKFSLLPLLRGGCSIPYLSLQELIVSADRRAEGEGSSIAGLTRSPPLDPFTLLERSPINLSIGNFSIQEFCYQPLPIMHIEGSLQLGKHADSLFLQTACRADGLYQELIVTGGKREGRLAIRCDIRADGRTAGWSPIQGEATMSMTGPWNTWHSLLLNRGYPIVPLRGEIKGNIDRWNIQKHLWESPGKVLIRFEIGMGDLVKFDQVSLEGKWAQVAAKAKFSLNGEIKEADCSIRLASLQPLSQFAECALEGSLHAKGKIKNGTAQGDFDLLNGQIGALSFQKLHTSFNLFAALKEWKGTLQFYLEEDEQELRGESFLRFTNRDLEFSNFQMNSATCTIGGDLSWLYQEKKGAGTLRLQATDLTTLTPFFPTLGLKGQAGIEVDFLQNSRKTVRAFGSVTDFDLFDWHIGEATVNMEVDNVQDQLSGRLDFYGAMIYRPNFYLAKIDLQARGQGLWEFDLEAEGTWQEYFQLAGHGTYLSHGEHKREEFSIHELKGSLLHHNFALTKESSLRLSRNSLELNIPELRLGEGNLSILYSRESQHWRCDATINKFPLSCFTFLTPWNALSGEGFVNCAIESASSHITGSCQLSIHDLYGQRLGRESPFQADGSLFANFNGAIAQVNSAFYGPDEQILLFNAALPFAMNERPYFPISLDYTSPCHLSLLVEAKLDELSEFLNTGFHRWSGWVAGNLLVSHTLAEPLLEGEVEIAKGSYENDYLGLKVENIDATVQATEGEVRLTSLHATGEDHQGTLSATGHLCLRPDEAFPYHLEFNMEQFSIMDLSSIEGSLTGRGALEGNQQKSELQGMFGIDHAKFSMPRSLPLNLPDIPVEYIHWTTPIEPVNAPSSRHSFAYDLSLHAKDVIQCDAGSLVSLWNGDIHIHGANLDWRAQGSLRLVKGQLSLLGRTFQLNQGEISFSDQPGQEGVLNISGALNTNGINITANLRGAFSSPQLTLQSVPVMTTSELFSLILFNKQVTEIKPMQAVQLAHTIMAISTSSGWNFVDHIGTHLQFLGIDTFDVIPSEEGLNQTSITIGKHFYLVRGVLVSLTQSLSSSRFLVEVDLGRGVIFQAENESSEAQTGQIGKFSLTWNKNY